MSTDSNNPVPSLSRRGLIGGAGALALATTSAVTLGGTARAQETITENQEGTHGGFYFSFWTDAPGTVSMTLNPGGSYSTSWSNTGNSDDILNLINHIKSEVFKQFSIQLEEEVRFLK